MRARDRGIAAINSIRRFPDLDHYGQDAASEAKTRADALLDKGDLDGYAVWKRILRAVEELQRTELAVGDRVH